LSFTVVSALRWWVREATDQIALNIDGVSVSYGELYDWARGSARWLSDRGIQPGERVGVVGAQSVGYIALALGLQLIGAIAVPLNTRFTRRELRTAIEDTTPKFVFADRERLDLARQSLEGLNVSLVPLEDAEAWRAPPGQDVKFHPTRDTLIAIMSTSGSTAKPKFVKFNHDMVVAIALELMLTEPRIRRGRTLILSPFFSGGLYVIFEYIVLGCTQFVLSRLQGESLLDLLVRERITVFPCTPIFLERVASVSGFAQADLSALIWTTVGGARVPATLVQKYRDKGILLRCLYGQTEAGGSWCSTGRSLQDPLSAGCGGPFSEWGIMRGDEFLPPGEVGEIVIRGPTVTPGYWNDPDATRQILREGWLHTGDLGKVDEHNSLTFVDRLKDIIISGGLNISAVEVESVISGIPGVVEVAVIAANDEKFGETPLAVLYAPEHVTPEAVVAHCNQALANYKVPRYVVLEAEPLPRLPSGKISKPLLREKYRDAVARLTRLR
jgi:fatty-acyl-CoA synthase